MCLHPKCGEWVPCEDTLVHVPKEEMGELLGAISTVLDMRDLRGHHRAKHTDDISTAWCEWCFSEWPCAPSVLIRFLENYE